MRTRTLVTDGRDSAVTTRSGDSTATVQTYTILGTAGVKSSPLGEALAKSADVELDRTGRVKVAPDLTIPGPPDIFVIGDLAHVAQQEGKPLPGLASVAIQEGRYVGKAIRQRLQGQPPPAFHHRHQGNLAIIGRHAGVADFGRWHLPGFVAW